MEETTKAGANLSKEEIKILADLLSFIRFSIHDVATVQRAKNKNLLVDVLFFLTGANEVYLIAEGQHIRYM